MRTDWGEDLRKSNTLGEQTYYYALTLNDGNILRVAKTVDNVQPAIMDMLPYMAVIAVGMICLPISCKMADVEIDTPD